jgi:hypothetical protein
MVRLVKSERGNPAEGSHAISMNPKQRKEKLMAKDNDYIA